MFASIYRLLTLFMVGLIGLVLTPAPAQARSVTHVIDFTKHGQGWFQPNFFADEGIIFDDPVLYTSNWWVGYVQGDEALVNDVYASFKRPISSLSLQVAPSSYGPITYTLTAFSASGAVVVTKTVTVSHHLLDTLRLIWENYHARLSPSRLR